MKKNELIRFDWAIKNILRNKANFPVLEGFLSELLHTDVKINSLLESESNQRFEEDKVNRVDILAELTGNEKVIIEVQCFREWDFLSRMVYGVSKVVVDHLHTGDPYGKIPRVISVNIVYFDLGEGQDYIYHGTTQFKGIHKHDILQLAPKEKEKYPDHIDTLASIFPEYFVLKVDQFDLKIKDTLDEWMYTLKQSEVRPEFKAKGIQEAGQKLELLRLSEDERLSYERHVKVNRISNSVLETYFSEGRFEGKTEGKAEGLAEGLVKGKAEGKAETETSLVKTMHQAGMSIEQLSHFTGLALAHIKSILDA